jgi:hypothetical protein
VLLFIHAGPPPINALERCFSRGSRNAALINEGYWAVAVTFALFSADAASLILEEVNAAMYLTFCTQADFATGPTMNP